MNTRAFGPDPDLNAALAVAAFAALQHNLVLPTAKHFPGDGLTDGNTHTTFVVNDASRDHLESTILKPFRAAIAAGCDGVMTIPACYTALDPDRSAITSRYVNTGLLRSEIGFKGLIVTDSLGMKGAQIGMEAGRLPGVEALKAGADILLHLTIDDEGLKDLYDGIEQALADGSYDPAEFEASTRRILRMKQKYCLFENPAGPDPADPSSILAHLARPEDAALSASHGDRAVVLLEDNGVLPLAGKRVLYVGPDRVFQDPGSTWYNATDKHFGEALAAHDPSVRSVTFMLPFDPAGVAAEVADRVDGVDVVVLGTLQGRFSMEQQQLVEWLIGGAGRPLVHVMLGVPFDYFQTEGRVAAAVAVMGCRSAMVDAGARFLYGKIPASGAMAYVFEGEGSGAGVDPIPGGPHPVSGDRCAEQGVSCSGDGLCVDTGTVVGCVCQPNWHPSAAGTDCVPDGSGG
jgi:beta-N-acetylhexosaminidase